MFNFEAATKTLTIFPRKYTQEVGFDWETTGVNLQHDDRPFMLSLAYSSGLCELFEADVDPMTRQPQWTEEQKAEIAERFSHKDWLYIGSNAKFDVRCTDRLLNDPYGERSGQPKAKVFNAVRFLKRCHDTIQMHHRVNNVEPHGLKPAGVKYAGMSASDEKDLKEAIKLIRTLARPLGWKIANEVNCPHQQRAPSAAQGGWAVMDMWLPRAWAKHQWETSRAYVALKKLYDAMPKNKSFADWASAYIIRFGVEKISRYQGWEWHPKEVHPDNVHPYWSLCAKYCTKDSMRSLILKRTFQATLEADGLYDSYMADRTALPISYSAEQWGITLKVSKAKEMIAQFKMKQQSAEYAVQNSLNLRSFNCRSSNQIRRILYGFFGLPVTRYTKKKKNKPDAKQNPTTDSDFLAEVIRLTHADMLNDGDVPNDYLPPFWQSDVESYADYKLGANRWYKTLIEKENPSTRQAFAFCCALLTYKRATTAITYLESYLAHGIPHPEHPDYVVLHPSFNPVGCKTPRYSGSNPNPQNISKGGKGKKGLDWFLDKSYSLRVPFGPTPDREWWDFDYHQIQLIIFAFASGDKALIAAAERGEDFHTFMACRIFGYTPEQWKALPEERVNYCRDIAKTVNFAFIFGAQEDKLNRTAGMPGLYGLLANMFPTAIKFLEDTEKHVRKFGYVTCCDGTRLFVPETTQFAGVNYRVQGDEAIIVKKAMVGIEAWLNKKLQYRNDARINFFVHDSIVFDVRKTVGIRLVRPITTIMVDAAKSFGYPIKVDAKLFTESWAVGRKLLPRKM